MKKIFYAICIIVVASFAALCYSQSKTYTDAERSALLARSDSLFAVGVDLYNAGKYTEAIDLSVASIKIIEGIGDQISSSYYYKLYTLASYNSAIGKYTTAIELYNKTLDVIDALSGKDNSDYAATLNQIGLAYYTLGKNDESIRYETAALDIIERIFGKENADYAMALSNLAANYSILGNYTESIRLGTEALNIRERILGKEHPDYENLLSDLAGDYLILGNYDEAIRLDTEVLNIHERISGKDHDYAVTLNRIGITYYTLGKINESISYETAALDIIEKIFGKENNDYAMILSNLSVDYRLLGNYSEAIRLGTEALNIREKLYGKEHTDYALSLNNLSLCYYHITNYNEAIRLGTEALNIREKLLGKEHPDYASSLSNLALYYDAIGSTRMALGFETDAVNIMINVLKNENQQNAEDILSFCTYLAVLGDLYSKVGQYKEAIEMASYALKKQKAILGNNHPDVAHTLHELSYYNFSIKNYAEAIRLELESQKTRESFWGKTHQSYVSSLSYMAGYYYADGDITKASECQIEVCNLTKDIVCRTFLNLTTDEKSFFWNKYRNLFIGDTPFFAYNYHVPNIISTAYSGLLFGKGLLLNAETELRKAILESGNEAAVTAIDELKINQLMLNKQLELPISERTLSTDSLNNVISELEHKLISISKEYGDYTKNLRIDVKDVQAKLTKDDIAVEFASFVDNDTTIYCAYLLKPEYESPKMEVCLKQTDQNVFADVYSNTELSKAIWGTLADVLIGVKNIYFAPSGELYNIAIESLPDWENPGQLVSDRWNFYRLSSTRELALIKDKNQIKKSVVYGGLKYDTDTATIVRDSKKYRSLDLASFSSAIADSLNLRNGVADLPGTKIEAKAIDSKLRAVKIDDIVRTDTIGTEASFKALSGQKKNLLHIATHGFYWTETEAKDAANLSFLLGNDEKRYQEDKALTRSGLLFAGANNALKGQPLPDGVDDGILTAQEISQLDLRGLDLVVLSACETGLGEITGDGVFGLQRGFKKAGAQSIMMSLWKVDDEATQMLMTQFYTNLTSGKSKRQSLLDAQRYLREYEVEETVAINGNLTPFQKKQLEKQGKSIEQKTETRKIRPYSDPRYWAAFILLDAID